MHTANVQIAARMPSEFAPSHALDRLTFTGLTREDIRKQVAIAVRMAYSQAAAVVAEMLPAEMQADLAMAFKATIESETHLVHYEWGDGTTEAEVIPLSMSLVAEAMCTYMIHRRFNEGALPS